MIDPIIKISSNYCTKCKTENTLEVENQWFKKIPFASFIKIYNTEAHKTSIYKIRCRKCRAEYIFDWRDGTPKPLILKHHLDEFNKLFIEGK